jgi:hypothetical protein
MWDRCLCLGMEPYNIAFKENASLGQKGLVASRQL